MAIRNAIQALQSEGLTVAEHGRGVFVRSHPPVRRLASDRFARRHREQGKAAFIAETEGAGGNPTVDSIKITEERPSADVAERLGITSKDPVIARSRRYLTNGQPVEAAISYIPVEIARDIQIARTEISATRLRHLSRSPRTRRALTRRVRESARGHGPA